MSKIQQNKDCLIIKHLMFLAKNPIPKMQVYYNKISLEQIDFYSPTEFVLLEFNCIQGLDFFKYDKIIK